MLEKINYYIPPISDFYCQSFNKYLVLPTDFSKSIV